MKTKLTLRLDASLIKDAKAYASRTGKPLSRIVSDLFTLIKKEEIGEDKPLTPLVKSLRGVLKDVEVSEE